jgi:hypothetical protein
LLFFWVDFLENTIFVILATAIAQKGKATEEDVVEGEEAEVKVEDEGAAGDLPKKDAMAADKVRKFCFLPHFLANVRCLNFRKDPLHLCTVHDNEFVSCQLLIRQLERLIGRLAREKRSFKNCNAVHFIGCIISQNL